ncbi:MAG: tRNA (adenosine(37)-N6)-threonylcarbamoyltransferase complex ATPase subunit type 1 TsaE [Syntrophorhabdaceae bacterium]|nr:tRNA (adenosine(37)-N6)-threonylcarbamoyltransferase complex ATPase subunit type 1 TsaE [Syntrophorhabdaceae bacterium]
MEKREFISKGPSETWEIGELIGKKAKPGEMYGLYGELGSGKTQLVKGMAKGIGVKDWFYVTSPTFAIMNVYEGKMGLCHVDLYRVQSQEVEDLDLEAFLKDGIVVIEWAERTDWEGDMIRVDIEVTGEEERKITVTRL